MPALFLPLAYFHITPRIEITSVCSSSSPTHHRYFHITPRIEITSSRSTPDSSVRRY